MLSPFAPVAAMAQSRFACSQGLFGRPRATWRPLLASQPCGRNAARFSAAAGRPVHGERKAAMKMTTEEAFVKTLQMHGIKNAFGIIGRLVEALRVP